MRCGGVGSGGQGAGGAQGNRVGRTPRKKGTLFWNVRFDRWFVREVRAGARAYPGVDLGHALLVRVELRRRRALRVLLRGSLPGSLLGLGLGLRVRVRGCLRLGSILGCLGLGLGVGLRGFHLLRLGLGLGRGVQLGERPLEQVPNEPRLGAHRRRPRRHGAVRTGRARCETLAKSHLPQARRLREKPKAVKTRVAPAHSSRRLE